MLNNNRRFSLKHDDLCDAAKDALTKVFSDQSVGRSTTRESLRDLRDEINTMLRRQVREE